MSDIYYHSEIPSEHDWTSPLLGEFCADISPEAINEWIAEQDKKWFPQTSQEPPRNAADLEDQFRRHADKWEQDTAFMSATPMRVMHESYQSIMAMGPAVVPILLRDLDKTHRHWFWALRHLNNGIDPVSPADRGNVRKMINAWVKWGKTEGKI
jgi:hypothetical protein